MTESENIFSVCRRRSELRSPPPQRSMANPTTASVARTPRREGSSGWHSARSTSRSNQIRRWPSPSPAVVAFFCRAASRDTALSSIGIDSTKRVLVERYQEKVCSSTTLISSLEDELDQNKQKLRDLQIRREDPSDIFMEIKKMTSEVEQLRNATKASKSEAIMLPAEIEQMKASIGTPEVRCVAAKKIEEAARAAEALVLAEIKILLSNEASAEDLQGTDGVSLSAEEYSELAARALEADEILRKKVEAAMARPKA